MGWRATVVAILLSVCRPHAYTFPKPRCFNGFLFNVAYFQAYLREKIENPSGGESLEEQRGCEENCTDVGVARNRTQFHALFLCDNTFVRSGALWAPAVYATHLKATTTLICANRSRGNTPCTTLFVWKLKDSVRAGPYLAR